MGSSRSAHQEGTGRYLRTCPSAQESRIEQYRGEPYVYSQMVAGPDSGTPGEAKNAWLTGTAAWTFLTVSQGVLGIQPDFDGLRIDPCIPSNWPGFMVQRQFRGATYTITVENPSGLCRGVKAMTVDDRSVAGNVIPLAASGSRVEVKITLEA